MTTTMTTSSRIRKMPPLKAITTAVAIAIATSSTTVDAQQKVPNVISSLNPTPAIGCFDTGPQQGNTFLYDGFISNYVCPPSSSSGSGSSSGGVQVLPELIVQSKGPSILSGIRVYANTGSASQDPTSFAIDGRRPTTDAANNDWIPIAAGQFNPEWINGSTLTLGLPPVRNNAEDEINSSFEEGDVRHSFGYASFENNGLNNNNVGVFGEYRVRFPTLRGDTGSGNGGGTGGGTSGGVYMLQIGELELVGELVPDWVAALDYAQVEENQDNVLNSVHPGLRTGRIADPLPIPIIARANTEPTISPTVVSQVKSRSFIIWLLPDLGFCVHLVSMDMHCDSYMCIVLEY